MAATANVSSTMDLVNDTGRHSNITIEELNSIETEKHLVVIIICVLIMIIGILGNILVLVIYKLKFKRSSARTYILALALADVSVCIVGIPYHVMDLTMLLVYNYSYTCKILSFLIGICTNSSVFILIVVGLDRFLKVTRPLKRQIVDFGDRKACLIAVGFAALLSVPNGILYGHSTVESTEDGIYGVECFIDDSFVESIVAIAYMGVNLLTFIISLVFLVVIYGIICKKIYQQDKAQGEMNLKKSSTGWCSCLRKRDDGEEDGEDEMEEDLTSREETAGQSCNHDNVEIDDDKPLQEDGTHNNVDGKINSDSKKQSSKKPKPTSKGGPRQTVQTTPSSGMVRHVQNKEKNTRKITLMMLTITVVFAVSYLPFITISILTAMFDDYWDTMGHTESVISDLMLRIYLINNMANPIIYSFWDLRFRRECIGLFKRICLCGKADGRALNGCSTGTSSRFTKNTIVTRTK